MPDPQTENGLTHFTPVPNEALERLAAEALTGREFRIILVVLRKTLGWSKERDKIPMSQFARFTGVERRNCHVVLTSLVKRKIIKKTVVAYGDRKIINYSFNDIYAEWKPSPPTATKAKKKVVATHGDTLSPPITTILSPSITHSIDKDRNLSKESSEEPLGPPERVQGLSLPTDNGDGMISICTRCHKMAETVRQNGENLCIRCFKKDDRRTVCGYH